MDATVFPELNPTESLNRFLGRFFGGTFGGLEVPRSGCVGTLEDLRARSPAWSEITISTWCHGDLRKTFGGPQVSLAYTFVVFEGPFRGCLAASKEGRFRPISALDLKVPETEPSGPQNPQNRLSNTECKIYKICSPFSRICKANFLRCRSRPEHIFPLVPFSLHSAV